MQSTTAIRPTSSSMPLKGAPLEAFDPHALDDELAHIDRGGDIVGWTAAHPTKPAPRAKVARKKAKAAAPAPLPFWLEPAKAAFAVVGKLLKETITLEVEGDGDYYDALLVLDVASQIALSGSTADLSGYVPEDQDDMLKLFEGGAFRMTALLNASLHFPAQKMDPIRQLVARRALFILNKLTDATCSGMPVGQEALPQLLEAVASEGFVEKAYIDSVERSKAEEVPATGRFYFERFTPFQVTQVLQAISRQTVLLRDFLSYARCDAQEGRCTLGRAAATLHMAEHMTMLIGAQADHLQGGGAIGSVSSWTTGDEISPCQQTA